MQQTWLKQHHSTWVHRIDSGKDLIDLSIKYRPDFDPIETLSMIIGNLIEKLPLAEAMEVCELWGFEEVGEP